MLFKRSLCWGGLGSAATTLGDAVANLGTLAASQALSASSSDASKITVQNTGSTSPTTYTVSDLTQIATAASETSLSGYADSNATAVSSTGKMQLTVGSTPYPFTLTTNSLVGLRDQINGLNAGVTATILTTGSLNYLSVSSNSTGHTTLSLVDDPGGAGHANTQRLTNTNQGTDALFKLNGVPVDHKTNSINDVVPGLSFNLVQPTGLGNSVTLTLVTDPSQLSSAISSFVSAYNALVDNVKQQVGSSAGLLSGDFAVNTVQADLRAVSSYSANGTVKSLADMGVTFDQTGHMSFSSSTFNSLSTSQIQGALAYFGSSTTGFGLLAQKFTSLTDPISGAIKLEEDGFDRQDTHLQSQITTLTLRINTMQTNLSAQLEKADTLLAGLESQQSMLTASVQSLNYVLYGKQVQ
jgi:flagellar hook-associated protein 2